MSNFLVVKDKVQRYARELFDDVRIDSDGDVAVPLEDTVVYIRVWEREFSTSEEEKFYDDNQLSKVMVNVWSYSLLELKENVDLFKWVATEGQSLTLGHFLLVPTDEKESSYRLIFANSLSGDTLDPGELKGALLAVASSARDGIELLKPRFGGKTFMEVSN